MDKIRLIKKKKWFDDDNLSYISLLLREFGIHDSKDYKNKVIYSVIYIITKHGYIVDSIVKKDGISTLLRDPENQYIINDIYKNTGVYYGSMASLVGLFTISDICRIYMNIDGVVDTAGIILMLDRILRVNVDRVAEYADFKDIYEKHTSIHKIYNTASLSQDEFSKINNTGITTLLLPEDLKPYMTLMFYDATKVSGKVYIKPYLDLFGMYKFDTNNIKTIRQYHIDAVKTIIKGEAAVITEYDEKINMSELKGISMYMVEKLCSDSVLIDIKATLRGSKLIYRILDSVYPSIKRVIYNIIILAFVSILIYAFMLKHFK